MTAETTVNGASNQQKWLVFGIMTIVLIANVVATYAVFTEPFPGHNDFLTPWEATRAFWIDGRNPYSEEVADDIQQLIFGREPLPEEDPGYFAYPIYASYLIVPTIYFEYAWASAIWMVFLEVCLILSMFVLFDMFKWFPKPLMLLVMMLWGLLFYPASRGLILGQISHFVYLLQVMVLWMFMKKQDTLSGGLLAISTLKPQMGYLLVPLLLLWAIKNKRWRFVYTFSAVFIGLLVSSFVIFPEWFSEWMNRLSVYQTYTIASPMSILTQDYLGLGNLGETLGTGIGYLLVFYAWYDVLIRGKNERMFWVIIWTLTLTHIVAPRTASPHFVIFTIPIVFYIATLRHTLSKMANVWIGGMLALSFFLPWVHFLLTVGGVNGEQEDPSFHLVLPLTMLVVLWLTRKMWWEHAPTFSTDSTTINIQSVEGH